MGDGSGEGGGAELRVLEVVRACQQGNGLRHRDYQRYREYCARRLRRLRKGLDFKLAGPKTEFALRHVSAEDARRDERFLLIPLMNAERAWAYAMQLKDENQDDSEPRKRIHLVRRLAKAAQWAAQLRDISTAACDDRSQLEAEAYCACMAGSVLLEKELWKEAFVQFDRAKAVYEQLSLVSSPEARELFRERLDELEPSLRYCSYNLAREGGPGSSQEDALRELKAQGANDLMLQSKIRKVMAESRQGESERAACVVWKGREVPVRSDKVRVKLLEIRDQREELSKAVTAQAAGRSESVGGEGESSPAEALFLEILSVFDEAGRTIREEQARLLKQAASGVVGDNITADGNDLLAYIKAARLQVELEHSARYAEDMEARFGRHSGAAATGDAAVQPQDVVHMYDRVLQSIGALRELFGTDCPGTWETFSVEDLTPSSLDGLAACYNGKRTCYISLWYQRSNQWAEAIALLDFGLEQIGTALASSNDKTRGQLAEVEKELRAAKVRALGESFKARLGTSPVPEVADGAGLANLTLCDFPPEIEPVPVHPVVFDLAFSKLDIGDFSGELAGRPVAKQQAATAPSNSGGGSDAQMAEEKPSGWLSSARGWFGRG